MFRACASSTALALLCASAQASAAPSARLVYARDADSASCPDEAAVRAAVSARLGYDPFLAYASSTMFAEIWRDGPVYRARIRLVDSNDVVRGARELVHPGERCSDMVDTMALTMSIAIDPFSLAGPRRSPEQTEPTEVVEPEAPKERPEPLAHDRAAEDAPRPRAAEPDSGQLRAAHFEAAVGPTAWIGSAPGPSAGVIANGLARFRSVSALIEGRADFPASTEVPEGTVRTSLVLGTLGACGHAAVLFGCATSSLGSLRAEARGVTTPREATALHATAGARVGLAFAVSERLSVRAHLDGAVIVTPHHLAIGGNTVYTLPPVAAGATIVGAWRFF
jgi:hypothetical protein